MLCLDNVRSGAFETALQLYYPGNEKIVDDTKIKDISRPTDELFWGWVEFDKHILSLSKSATELQNIGY